MPPHPEREEYEDYRDNDPGPSTSTASGRSQSPDEDAESAVKKRKVSRACDVCRRRKVRCDFVQLPSGNLQKCLNCFSSKIECTFNEDNKPRKTSKKYVTHLNSSGVDVQVLQSYVQSLESKVERSEKLFELLCPDPQLREDLLEGDAEDIPTGALTPSKVRAAPSTDSDHPINLQALRKAVGLNPVEMTLLIARLQMHKRYPVDQDGNSTQSDDRHEDEHDHADADHLSRITEEQLRVKAEDRDDDNVIKPFYLGKSSARGLLAQVVQAKNQSRTPASSASPASSSERDMQTENDPASTLSLLVAHGGHIDLPGESLCAGFDVEMDGKGMGSLECQPEDFMSRSRPEYWQMPPWERRSFRHHDYQRDGATPFAFPEPTLLKSLVGNYFKHINSELPLLHRPTFEKEIAKGLHQRNVAFGSTVLLVCSLGAKYSTDPRVELSETEVRNASEEERRFMAELRAEDEDHLMSPSNDSRSPSRKSTNTYHSRGWKYFDQAWKSQNNHLHYSPPTLYDLQFYCLATEFLRGTSLPQASWVMIGIGVRLGQDIGVHRRQRKELLMDHELVKQEELRKRAFWVMITLDRLLSTATGRPCAILDESFDADLPIDCDDEYWDAPGPARFKQPGDKPSKIAAFILIIRLNQILAATLKTIYSTRKAKTIGGLMREQWEDKIVSEIDSALNKWLDVIPPHLRWNKQQPNEEFFMQSATLHAAFYHMQILVHRPFIPSPSHPTPKVDFPSLSICTHAARSLIHIGLAQLDRVGEVTINAPLQLLSAAVILLLRVWDDRRIGKLTQQSFRADMADLNSCLKILATAEKRWYSAGRLRDLLQTLIPDETVVNTVVTDLPKKVHQAGAQPHGNVSTMSPPLSAPSPFAPSSSDGAGWDTSRQNPPPHGGPSPASSNPLPGAFTSPPPRAIVPPGENYGQPPPPLSGNSSSGTAPSADPNAQWSIFASGSGSQTPQQFMFPDTQQPSSEAWGGSPSDFYQAQTQTQAQQGSHRRQNSSFPDAGLEPQGSFFSSPDYEVLNENALASAALDPNLFTLAGMNVFSPGDFDSTAGPFSQTFLPFWPGTTTSDPNSTMGQGGTPGINQPSSMPFESWEYLTGLVDLTSRNDLVDHLFPYPPQPGNASAPPIHVISNAAAAVHDEDTGWRQRDIMRPHQSALEIMLTRVDLGRFRDDEPGPSTRRTVSFSPGTESPDEDGGSAVKKRKMARACDTCRKRKVRCDFVELPSGDLQKCLNCFSAKIECTLTEANKPRRSSKDHVKILERQLHRSQKLLELLCPDPRRRAELLEGDPDDIPVGAITPILAMMPSSDIDLVDLEALAEKTGRNPVDFTDLGTRLQTYKRHTPDESNPQNDKHHENQEDIAEADHLAGIFEQQLKIVDDDNENPPKPFFYGKSSARSMLDQAIKVKREARTTLSYGAQTGQDSDLGVAGAKLSTGEPMNGRRETPSTHGSDTLEEPPFHFRPARWRPSNWQVHPWEKGAFRTYALTSHATIRHDFLEPSLLEPLIDNYFKHINIELPLLHRPTLDKQITEGLHRRDSAFRATVLLVCALGARYSTDPRVLVSEEERRFMGEYWADDEAAGPPHSSGGDPQIQLRNATLLHQARGWKYFDQAWKLMDNHLFLLPPTLYDLQFYCLATEYLSGASLPQASWVTIGIGIRLGLDVGAHRRSDYSPVEPESVKQEDLRKRAFWVLVSLDRQVSSITGRPCTMHDECIDTDLPIECDDEFWDAPDPAMMFKQPEGKPSKMTAFILTIQLNQILLTCLRALYSFRKTKVIGGLTREQWEDKVVSDIDSALNKWFEDIPPHLRWDPQGSNDEFFMQSAILHASFYNLQILAHRPFIPSPRNPTPATSFPSLAICTRAAKSLIRVGLAQVDRLGEVPSAMPLQLLSASVVLLLKVWEDRRKGKLTEQTFRGDLRDLHGCLKILAEAEKRWYTAGKLRDLLQNLIPEDGAMGTVTGELSKGAQQQMDAEPSPGESSIQSPSSRFSPSPFAPSPNQPTFHPGSSASGLSPMDASLHSAPSPSIQASGPPDDVNYEQQASRAAPSAGVNEQWPNFTLGPSESTSAQTPQQFMFTDVQGPGGDPWGGHNVDFYQPPQSQASVGSAQPHSSLFSSQVYDLGALNESALASAALDPDLYNFGSVDSFASSELDWLQGASFGQASSPFWPGTTTGDPNSMGQSDTSGNNTSSTMPFDSWQYLTGLVDLTSRNDLVDHLFPNPPQSGYGSGPPSM